MNLPGVVKGVCSSLWKNKYNIIAIFAFPAVFNWFAGYVMETGNENLAIYANLFYALSICSVCVHAPWIFMGVTCPQSWGHYINNNWNDVFEAMKGEKQIDAQFKIVWVTYLVLVIVFGWVASTAFVGVPSLGG